MIKRPKINLTTHSTRYIQHSSKPFIQKVFDDNSVHAMTAI